MIIEAVIDHGYLRIVIKSLIEINGAYVETNNESTRILEEFGILLCKEEALRDQNLGGLFFRTYYLQIYGTRKVCEWSKSIKLKD